jgi:hypothetical protein
MDDLVRYVQHKRDMGSRFKSFRIVLYKTCEELSAETGYPAEKIHLLELGAIFPDFRFLDYFSGKYGLSMTWIATGEGPIFYKKCNEIVPVFLEFCQSFPPSSEDFAEFIAICAGYLENNPDELRRKTG